jgi:putative transcriptional regulator
MSVLKGRLLVATPLLGDPNFERTVVLLLEHGDEGALGVVLNRPSDVDLVDALADWQPFAVTPPVVFLGGPVSRRSAIALAHVDVDVDADGLDGVQPVVGRVGVVDLGVEPDQITAPIARLRVFLGYAGWTEGQLEEEIGEGAWFVVDAEPDDAFAADPGDLWSRVLRRQPPPLSRYAHYPTDPSAN